MCSVTPSQLRTTVEQIPDTSSFSKDTELTEPVKARVRVCVCVFATPETCPCLSRRSCRSCTVSKATYVDKCLPVIKTQYTHTYTTAENGSARLASAAELAAVVFQFNAPSFLGGGKKGKTGFQFFYFKDSKSPQ